MIFARLPKRLYQMKFYTRFLIVAATLIATAHGVFSQTNNVGIGTTTPDPSAVLDVFATDKGFLPPRLTTAQRNAIANPAEGLQIYNSTDSIMEFWNGSCWIPFVLANCNDCYFTMSASATGDTIDHVTNNSTTVTLTLNQSNGNPQDILLSVVGALPPGITYTITPNPQFSSGTATVTFNVSPLTPAGSYPVVLQGLCGTTTQNLIFTITVTPCYHVSVANSVLKFNLGTELYIQNPSAPTGQPICVTCDVNNGVFITSDTNAVPAFTTGTGIPAGSVVAITNNGYIIGDGGNGGRAYDPAQTPPLTGAGDNGGDAMHLTIDATIQNNGYIWGGGGGGSGMAFSLSYTLPPPVNFVTIGVFLGAGGGGGAGGSVGGAPPSGVIGISAYSNGLPGTPGVLGLGGNGGVLNYPIPINVPSVVITLNPNAIGGDGGNYGYPGTQGAFNLTLSATLVINVPFVGQVSIPVVNNVAIPIPFPPPAPGAAGYAIKRNGFTTTIPDNTYQTSFLKGNVGP